MNTALEIEWEHFIHSPSRKDGIPEHVERYLRSDTCKFIDEFGKEESLAGKIRLLACSLFHTFYLRVSFKTIPRWETAVACLIIAAKIENKVQTIKKMTRAAAIYLRPHAGFDDATKQTLPMQQQYHWMSQIHIRERQIIERLYGELRTSLPIQSLDILKLRKIIVDKNESNLPPKNKYIHDIFMGCFAEIRKIFRSVLCIYYPPPWLAAVAVFKSLKRYNWEKKHNKAKYTGDEKKIKKGEEPINYAIRPKLYLSFEWFTLYDPTRIGLDLNTIQYISDEIDACDDQEISVKDYTRKPAELYGVNDLALLKRINLIRTTPFHQLPKEIQNDLRNCFKLKNTQYIDLRCHVIKQNEQKNKQLTLSMNNDNNDSNNNNNINMNCKLEMDNDVKIKEEYIKIKEEKDRDITPPHSATKLSSPPHMNYRNNDASGDWIDGHGPKQRDIIQALMSQHKKLVRKSMPPDPNLEEGEIEDGEIDDQQLRIQTQIYNNNNNDRKVYGRKRKRCNNNYSNEYNSDHDSFRNRNSNKNFETKNFKNQRRRRNIVEDNFHCGWETYNYVKKSVMIHDVYDEGSDRFFMNFCIQRFEYDMNGKCVLESPPIESNVKYESDEFIYRIPTPNYNYTTPSDHSGISPMTPGYGISPITPGYNGVNNMQVSNMNNQLSQHSQDSVSIEGHDAYWKRTYHHESIDENDLNDGCVNDIIGSHNSFITKTQMQRNNTYQNVEPPHKKMKLNHHRTA